MSAQERMKAQLDEIRRENDAISHRRTERDKEKAGGILEFLKLKHPERDERELQHFMSRSFRREGASGQPRSIIFSQKMKIPRKR